MNRRRLAVAVAASAALAPLPSLAQTEDAQCTYKASIGTMTSMLSWALDEVGRLTTSATAANFSDLQWQVDVLAPFAVAQAAQHTLTDLEPPSAFQSSHDLIEQAVDQLVLAQTSMEQGVLHADLAAINEANDHILRSNDLMSQATANLPS